MLNKYLKAINLGRTVLLLGLWIAMIQAQADVPGTLNNPVIDSQMSEREVFAGLDPRCSEAIRQKQQILVLRYYSFDGLIHQGQLVIDRDLVADVRQVFDLALAERFPIQSLIPLSDLRFRRKGRWDDALSMSANNTSSFNYRETTGSSQLSRHAYGQAIDINPRQNPYLKNGLILPEGAQYNTAMPGTLYADHALVKAFIHLGWRWGGNWQSLRDYQHFEKPLP